MAPFPSLLLAFLAATEPAPAAPSSVPARAPADSLARADALLAALDDEGARDLLLPLVDDPTVPRSQRAQAALRLGLAHANLSQPDLARAALTRALGEDPGVTLPPGASAQAQALLQAARADLAARQRVVTPLPDKPKPQQAPVLGWVRPTSVAIVVAGTAVMVTGGLTVVAAVGVREYVRRLANPAQQTEGSRLLVPLALAALAQLVLGVPTAGLGLALFFLSGVDGPLKDIRPDPDTTEF